MTKEEAINQLQDAKDGYPEFLTDEVLDMAIKALEQQPKIGHWIYDYVSADEHRVYHCSECGCYLKPKHSESLDSFRWCNLCGARMESEG